MKPTLIFRLFFFVITVVFGFFQKSFEINIFFCTLIFLLLVYESEWHSSVHMMFMVAFATFMYLPAIVANYYLQVDFDLFYLTSFCSFIFLNKTNKIIFKFSADTKSNFLWVYYIFGVLILILSIFEFYYVFSLWGPFAMFFALNLRPKSSFVNTRILLFYLFIYLIYTTYGWNGYGRSVTIGFLLTGVLYYFYAQDYKMPKVMWALLPGFASTLFSNRSFVDLEFVGLEASLRDSAFGPYILASSFLNYNESLGNDYIGFLESVIFTAFSFVPRDWWSDKPYGFGFEFVVRHMDYSFVDAGHSIASTMIGDHLYFLGYAGMLTAILMTLIVAWLCRYLYGLKRFHGFAVAIMACYMLVFVWGGMTSLSARLIFPFAVFIGYLIAEKIWSNLLRKNI